MRTCPRFITPCRAPVRAALGLILLFGLSGAVGRGEHLEMAAGGSSLALPAPARTTPEGDASEAVRRQIREAYGQLPIRFEANDGQFDPAVDFMTRGAGYSFFLTGAEAVMVVSGGRGEPDAAAGADTVPSDPEPIPQAVVRKRLVDVNPNPTVSSDEPLPGHTNYFIGNDPRAWRTHVQAYGRVRYAEVYPGIDVVYHGDQRELEYDFIVSPGADPDRIRIAFEGAERMEIDDAGDLLLDTAVGQVRQKRPFAYQEIDGQKTEVAAAFAWRGDGTVAFELGAYDRARPLVIDPILAYSTYLGGTGFDAGHGIAVDGTGNAYVTGRTLSVDFPTSPYALQASLSAASTTAFVTKLTADGSALAYSTYLGGTGSDSGNAIAVDAAGNTYVAGQTSSFDFPTSLGALQTSHLGGITAFVTKLNADGSALAYSTYFGGTRGDMAHGIAVDADGNAYVAGETSSLNFPTSPDALQSGYPGGTRAAFVTKLAADGAALAYSTYLGGTSHDAGHGIAVDEAGNAYITGFTNSVDFPTTAGALQTTNPGIDITAAFVAKLNAEGNALAYSTYLGGSGSDIAHGIAVDADGNAYVAGFTHSSDFPISPDALQTAKTANSVVFVAKLNAQGSGLAYSTYLGGSGSDIAHGIALDADGNAYVAGQTSSSNLPTSASALQISFPGFAAAFVARVNADGSALVHATYLGGSDFDRGNGIAVDGAGHVYVTGETRSVNLPTSPNAAQTTHPGSTAAFVTKLDLQNRRPVADAGLSHLVECTAPNGALVTLDGSASSDPDGDPLAFVWTDADENQVGTSDTVQLTVPLGTHSFTLAVSDGVATDSDTVTVTVQDSVAPTTTASYPAPNANGWYNADVTVVLSASDACSDVDIHYSLNGVPVVVAGTSAAVEISTEGINTLEYFASDAEGNEETPLTLTFNIDKTPPAIVLDSRTPPNANGWNNTDVTVAWTCSDATSGPVSTTAAQTVAAEGAGQSATGTCTDLAGNSASDAQGGINIDRTPPAMAIVAPEEGASFPLGEAVTATYTCIDALSGVATCAGPVASGAALDTSSVGAGTFAVTATDAAGNTTTLVHSYGVHYAFAGFFSPVSNDTTNVVNAGRVVPLRWEIQDGSGNPLLDLGAVTNIGYRQVACVSESVTNPLEGLADDAGASDLRVVGTEFHFNWKTERRFANTCMEVAVELNDGSAHRARFRFAR